MNKDDLRTITVDINPRVVIEKLQTFRYVARTAALHQTFAEAQG